MKILFRVIAVWYFYGGLALGFIVWFSYMWGVQFAASAEVPMAERVKAAWSIQTMIAPDVGTRVIAWGPSLAIWVAAPNEQPFGKWLAPGFYVRRLSPAVLTAPRPRQQPRS
jgi:hypothetical protein